MKLPCGRFARSEKSASFQPIDPTNLQTTTIAAGALSILATMQPAFESTKPLFERSAMRRHSRARLCFQETDILTMTLVTLAALLANPAHHQL